MYDPLDSRGVPSSRGLPKAVQYFAFIGILLIFAIGGFVIHEAWYGHQWPADKVLRLPLDGRG